MVSHRECSITSLLHHYFCAQRCPAPQKNDCYAGHHFHYLSLSSFQCSVPWTCLLIEGACPMGPTRLDSLKKRHKSLIHDNSYLGLIIMGIAMTPLFSDFQLLFTFEGDHTHGHKLLISFRSLKMLCFTRGGVQGPLPPFLDQ